MNLELDALWDAIDMDGDEVICLEEVAHQHGAALAEFRHWARTTYGSCAASWEQLRLHVPPNGRWKSPTSMLYAGFLQALRAVKWAGLDSGNGQGHVQGPKLCSGLDLAGCGIVSKGDFEWLDKWEAPEWLCMEPDQDAWCELAALLLEVHGQPLKAWRAMDEDDSNIVSWSEFKAGAAAVGFKGNVPGAWRVLDDNVSGTITLQEFDGPSSELLQSFKEWLDTNYGSVEFAFKQIDTDGSGSLTCNELKRACKRMNWEGDVQNLFNCLAIENVPGKRSLSSQDLAFLDTWKPNPDEWEGEVDELAEPTPKGKSGSTTRKAERPRSSTSQLLPLAQRPVTPGTMAPSHYDFPAGGPHKPRTQKSGHSGAKSEGNLHKVYGVLPPAARVGHPSRPPKGSCPTEEDKVAHIKAEMAKIRSESSKLEAEGKKFRDKAQKVKAGQSPPKLRPQRPRPAVSEGSPPIPGAEPSNEDGRREEVFQGTRPTTGNSDLMTMTNSRVVEISQGPK